MNYSSTNSCSSYISNASSTRGTSKKRCGGRWAAQERGDDEVDERRGVGCTLRTAQSILVSSSPSLPLFVGSPWRSTLPLALASTRVVATRSVVLRSCLAVLAHGFFSSLPSSSATY
ncbi:hypothetical protein DFH09DRAFT_1325323 [Mycena vulgaris]|nr:hypothetical protein DFH09DRAFT_1325323 [Mycena vulgaris]